MTCAKRKVSCYLLDARGDLIASGTNDCANPQEVCPREPGEGYGKCKSICKQRGHAETVAIENAGGYDLFAGKAIILHDRVCDDCREQLARVGIASIELVP